MYHLKKQFILAAAVSAALAAPGAAFATNGYFAHGYGTKNKGMAGAGVAMAQDTIAAATNPAAMVYLGERLDVGAAIFNPNREYSNCPVGPGGCAVGAAESDSDYFLIPHFGYNWMLGSDKSVGLTVYGNGGMNTNYDENVFGGGDAGVNLAQVFIAPSYAQKFGNFSLGADLILAYQKFKATGLSQFAPFSADPTSLTNNGSDTSIGFGLRIGGMVELGSGWTLGAAYQPEIDMDEFDDYAGLFADQGDFDIPSTYTLGAAWQVNPKWTLALDWQAINYEDVPSVSNPINSLFLGNQLGSDDGPGFGWEDINVVKLGAAYQQNEQWTWRFGWNQGDQPIPDDQTFFNILAPGVMEDHLTFGFTRSFGNDSEFNLAFMHALETEVKGDPGLPDLQMDQYELELSFGKRF